MLALRQLLNPTTCSFFCRSATNLAGQVVGVRRVELANGKIRFLLFKVYVHGQTLLGRTILRGWKSKDHDEIYSQTKRKIEGMELCTQCLGGGKMRINERKRRIRIYGKSKVFGQSDHRFVRDILSTWSKYKHFRIKVEY